ncbi:MAG: hypothetical protein RL722_2430 [Pseudomonadota bacterium]|jgi:hypothetical protein
MNPLTSTVDGSAGDPPQPPLAADPGLVWKIANLGVSQAGWLAAVLGAAQGQVVAGTLVALAGVAWHLGVVERPGRELRLVLAVALLGTLADAAVLHLAAGAIQHHAGLWSPAWPPYWLSALWALFATSLNVTLRALRGRGWLGVLLCAALGGVAGPLAYAGGVRLGAATFLDIPLALTALALEWALMLPLLLALAARWDGVIGTSPSPKEIRR